MKAGFFSPLPPAKTGVADYSFELLKALRKLGQVEVNDTGADVALYHIGNNQLHAEVNAQAIAHPGVVVLHDAVLHHFHLGSLSAERYVDEFVYNYGEWTRDLAAALFRGRARSGSDARYFEYAMLRRITEKARAVIVHNASAAELVRRHSPEIRVVQIPHLFVSPVSAAGWQITALRKSLGVSPGTTLFGVFGHLRESKRVMTVLRVIQRLRSRGLNAMLLVAGNCVSTDMQRALADAGREPGVIRISYLEEPLFWLHAHAVDACINLRFPAAGETSGIAIRLMGVGKPVILSDGPETRLFPGNACLRVDVGLGEEEMLEMEMEWLSACPAHARRIGENARSYISAEHNVERCAELYWQTLLEARG